MNRPQLSPEEIERQMAEYEERLREQLLREHENAELLERHQEAIATKTFLPVIGSSVGTTCATHRVSA